MPGIHAAARHTKVDPGTHAARFAALLLALLLAGCDSCGDWISPFPGSGQVCRQQAPRPQ
jgi:hypothetical protein